MGKLTSWASLFVAFGCWFYTLMWFQTDRSWGSIYMICAVLWGVMTSMLTTLLSPRKPIYDIIRYFLMAVLVWIGYHVHIGIVIGITILALLFLPSVIVDFKGGGEERREQTMKTLSRSWRKHEDGVAFEKSCAAYLRKLGYYDVRMTKTTGDFGADLTAYDKAGNKWVFQCKRYSNNVGIAAVQQAVAAKAHYGASFGGVMTNARMTEAAKQLAWENAIELFEGLSD